MNLGQSGRSTYSDLAPTIVPEPTRRRRDRVLFYLRSMDEGESVTASQLAEYMRRNRLRDYNADLCRKDLHRLHEVGLVLSDYGHPARWWARGRLGQFEGSVMALAEAATAVVEWWRPENARHRSFNEWFDEVLPDLREALGLPRSGGRPTSFPIAGKTGRTLVSTQERPANLSREMVQLARRTARKDP